MTQGLLALCGLARSGKDQFAASLILAGWSRQNMGDIIKETLEDFCVDGDLDALEVMLSERVFSEEEEGRLRPFLEKYARPYAVAGHSINPFTEDDRHKALVREILEHGGDVIHTWIEQEYFRGVDSALRLGMSVINTRLCRISEALAWRDRGGMIIQIRRAGHAPVTKWDAETVDTLRYHRMIDQTVINAEFTGDAWAARCRELAPTAGRLAALHRQDVLRGAA